LPEQEREAMAALCHRGIDPAQASDDDKSALRAAIAPVLDRLRRDPRTRATLEAIAAMRERIDPEPALTCSTKERASKTGFADGTYTTDITRDDIRVSGAGRQLSRKEIDDFARSTFSLVLDGNRFVVEIVSPEGRRGVVIEGTFSVYRDRFVATGSNGDVVRARFSFDGTSLRFQDVSAVADLKAIWGSRPWKRTPPR
jgi:hypothetical protein